jgi:hypothetical protein
VTDAHESLDLAGLVREIDAERRRVPSGWEHRRDMELLLGPIVADVLRARASRIRHSAAYTVEPPDLAEWLAAALDQRGYAIVPKQ